MIIHHTVDLCVVGGGMAGLCAAVAAARHGASVVLMQDRPVLGGNASSEIRMWICGAHGRNMRETGLLEEIELENLRRNPGPNYSIWDSVLYEKARFQENLVLLLNCACLNAEMDGSRIAVVRGW
ncbi:MAG: FAD-dependent oxidoreductase, partial [Clostridia bacterium]|nr:FAD-dependent oxidoreductase [Clostridia bacterium]